MNDIDKMAEIMLKNIDKFPSLRLHINTCKEHNITDVVRRFAIEWTIEQATTKLIKMGLYK
jgi:hypothetical protein